MLKSIDINFEKFIKYTSRLRATYPTRLVLKTNSLENTKRKYVLDRNVFLHKIDSKGKGR